MKFQKMLFTIIFIFFISYGNCAVKLSNKLPTKVAVECSNLKLLLGQSVLLEVPQDCSFLVLRKNKMAHIMVQFTDEFDNQEFIFKPDGVHLGKKIYNYNYVTFHGF